MENQEAKSKWDELARQIGAEVPPEAEQLVEASAPTPEAAPLAPPPRPAFERSEETLHAPRRPAAGWDNLASEFGLPVVESAPPPPVVELAVEEVVAVSKQVDVSEAAEVETPRRERTRPERREPEARRREQRPPRRERDDDHGRGRSQRRSREDHGGRPPRAERAERPRREERALREEAPQREERAFREEPPRREPPQERALRQERPEREVPQQREDRDEAAKSAPAVSLWQKIFGSPVEQAPEQGEAAPAEEEVTDRSEAREESRRDEEIDFDRPRDFDEARDVEDRGLEEPGEEPSTERRPRRPRRRRRGRGGKGDRPAEERGAESRQRKRPRTAEHVERIDEFDDLSEDDEDLVMEAGGDDSDVDILEEGETERTTSGRSRAAMQRTIPSWEEAIGHIVDVNMQARSQRRQSHAGSRSSSSRGRPRGRRKK